MDEQGPKPKSFELVKAALEYELTQINPQIDTLSPGDLDTLFANLEEYINLIPPGPDEKQQELLSEQRQSILQELPKALFDYKNNLSSTATPEAREKIVRDVRTRLLGIVNKFRKID